MRDIPKQFLNALFDGVYFLDTQRRITFWSQGATRITGFDPDEVLGRSCSDNILMHMSPLGEDLCRADCPVAATLRDGQERQAEVYLHHRAGHRLPVQVRILPIRDEAGTITGAVEIFSDACAKKRLLAEIDQLKNMSMRDPLTGLGNRRAAEQEFRRRRSEYARLGIPFGLLFADIDRFKVVNDTHGHAVGDRVLDLVARTLQNALRGMDTVTRWGGEEFLMILPMLDGQGLAAIAERVRRFVETSPLPLGAGQLAITVSVGGVLATVRDSMGTLVHRADAMMYKAKQGGRNRVELDLREDGAD